jgi:outer membrane biosynthesis protein TonB
MTNFNDPKNYDREVARETYRDASGETHEVTRVTETANSRDDSYERGYVHGKAVERSYQRADLAQRDNDNAARGLLLGLLFASIAALVGGFLWYINIRNNESVNPVDPIVVPSPSKPEASPSPEPTQEFRNETTIIERTKEVPVEVPVPVHVPVPQQQAPSQPEENTAPASPSPTTESTPSPTENEIEQQLNNNPPEANTDR